MQYVIWNSQQNQWHLSRVDGRTDAHTQDGTEETLQQYCDDNKLEYTIWPVKEIVGVKCVDTFEYAKV